MGWPAEYPVFVMGRNANRLEIAEEQLAELRKIIRRPTATQREIRRARIILERSTGASQQEVARSVGVQRLVVAHWEKRFRQERLAGPGDTKGRRRQRRNYDPQRQQCDV